MIVRYDADFSDDVKSKDLDSTKYTIEGLQFQILRTDEDGAPGESIIPEKVEPGGGVKDLNGDDKKNWKFLEGQDGVILAHDCAFDKYFFHLHVPGAL